MTISSEIFDNRTNTSKTIRIVEKHIDSVTGKSFKKTYVADNGFDSAKRLTDNAGRLQSDLASQEVNNAISLYIGDSDPLYDSKGNKREALYQTWLQLATATIRYFLELENKADLYAIKSVELNMSLADRKVVYGMTAPEINAVDIDVNDAVVINDDQKNYVPPYKDGVKQ